MGSIASWVHTIFSNLIPLGVGALLSLLYQVSRDRRQRRAARETIHQLLRPRFEDLYEHVRNRGTGPDGAYSELGALASGWLKEITQLLAQHAEKLPKGERETLIDAADKARKMDIPARFPAEVYKAARDALANAVGLLKASD